MEDDYTQERLWQAIYSAIILRAENEYAEKMISYITTNIVDEGPRVVLSSGRSLPKWYSDSFNTRISTEERRRLRSKTFPGLAEAIAEQWGKYIEL